MQYLPRSLRLLTLPFTLLACTDDGARHELPGNAAVIPVDVAHPGEDDDVIDPPPPITGCIAETETASSYGTASIDELRDVVVTTDGTIVVVGLDRGVPTPLGPGVLHSRGVALTYRDGTFTPVGTLDTPGTDAFESITIDRATDRIFLAARTNDALPGFPGAGNYDFVLGDLTSAGFTAMTRGFDDTPEMPKQIAARGGHVAVAGHEARLTDDGSTWINPFLASYTVDSAMAPQWFTTRRSPDSETYSAVDVSMDAIAAGGQISDGETLGMFVSVWNHDADVLWRTQVSSKAFDQIAAVRLLADGTVLWAGTANVTHGEVRDTDIVVGALDAATGEALWTKYLGTELDEQVVDVAIDGDGRIHAVGNVTNTATDHDVVLYTLDSEGTLTGEQQWGSTGIDVAAAIAVDSCGTAAIVGSTNGDLGGPSQGMRDGFVIIAR